jgi:hypothetical protein
MQIPRFARDDKSNELSLACSRAVEGEAMDDFPEFMIVVQGCYTLIIDDKRIPVRSGEEYFIPKGFPHGGEPAAGTRTIHAFDGRRADRTNQSPASPAISDEIDTLLTTNCPS